MDLERTFDVLVAFKGLNRKPAASCWLLVCGFVCGDFVYPAVPQEGTRRCAHYLVFIFIYQDFHTVTTPGAIAEKHSLFL